MVKKVEIIEHAMQIAIKAHEGQTRKDDNFPYVIHPIMVGILLMKHNFSEIVIASAIVHDVLEDTDITEKDLRKSMGNDVTDVVLCVSEDKSLKWEERKKKYIESVRNSSEEVKAVSIGDKIHNLKSLLSVYDFQGPNIWKMFNRGKDKKIWFEDEMLKMFKETWNHPLIDEYEKLVKKINNLV